MSRGLGGLSVAQARDRQTSWRRFTGAVQKNATRTSNAPGKQRKAEEEACSRAQERAQRPRIVEVFRDLKGDEKAG